MLIAMYFFVQYICIFDRQELMTEDFLKIIKAFLCVIPFVNIRLFNQMIHNPHRSNYLSNINYQDFHEKKISRNFFLPEKLMTVFLYIYIYMYV